MSEIVAGSMAGKDRSIPQREWLRSRSADAAEESNATNEGGTGMGHLAWFSALIYITLYMADLRLVWDRPMHLLVAPLLVTLSWPCFRGIPRRILGLGAVLTALWTCQGIVGLEFQWRSLLEVMLAVYFFSLTPFRSDWGRRWLAGGLGVFFTISFGVFLATIFVAEIRDIRASLYLTSEKTLASLESVALTEEAMTVQQGGLSPYLHLFGYQVAAGISLLFALATLQRGPRGWMWYPPMAIGIITLFLAGQRSAFLAVGIACIGVIVLLRRFRTAFLVLAGLGLLVAAVVHINPDVSELRTYNVVERMQTGESDFGARLALQWWAVTEVIRHPLGLVGADIDYFDVAPDLVGTRIVAPHNGYITRLLLYGWPIGVLTVVMLWWIGKMGRHSWKRFDGSGPATMEIAALLALLGVMSNALFHNASFTTFNADTLIMLFLYGVCSARRGSNPDWKVDDDATAPAMDAEVAPGRRLQVRPAGRPSSPLAGATRVPLTTPAGPRPT